MPAWRSTSSLVASPSTQGVTVDRGHPFGVAVHDHTWRPGVAELLGDGSTDPAPPAHDDVVAHRLDLLVHPAPLHGRSEVALDDELETDRERVQGRAHAGQDQHDREQLPGVVERLHLSEPDRRDRRDRLVQGVHHAEPEDDVAHGAHHHDPGQDEEADEDVANPPHRAQRTRRASSHGPVRRPRPLTRRPATLIISVTSWLPFGLVDVLAALADPIRRELLLRLSDSARVIDRRGEPPRLAPGDQPPPADPEGRRDCPGHRSWTRAALRAGPRAAGEGPRARGRARHSRTADLRSPSRHAHNKVTSDGDHEPRSPAQDERSSVVVECAGRMMRVAPSGSA